MGRLSEREEYLDELLKGVDSESVNSKGEKEEELWENYDKELEGIDEDDFLKEFEKSLEEEQLDFDLEEEILADTTREEYEPEFIMDERSSSSDLLDEIDGIDDGDLSIEDSLKGYMEDEPILDEIGQKFANQESEMINVEEEERDVLDMLSNMPGIEDLEYLKEDDVTPIEDEALFMAEALAEEIEGLGLELDDRESQTKAAEMEPQEEEIEAGKKKKGIFKRFMIFFFGEDTEETISDENEDVLEQEENNSEDEEKEKKKREKEEKKALKEKNAKIKAEKKAEEKKKKQQVASEKAEKKAQKQKEQQPVEKSKPLPKKPVVLILLFGLSIVILINLLSSLLGYNTSLSQAKDYYAQGKYVEAYTCLSKKDIKDADAGLYNKIKLNAYLQQEINSYEAYQGQRMYSEALGALICGVGRYDRFIAEAEKKGTDKEYKVMIQKIENSLKENYKMSLDEARDIYALNDKKEFTYAVYNVISELGLKEE